MTAPIRVSETFTLVRGKQTDTFRREADDTTSRRCERIVVTHLTCSHTAIAPYTFGTEPEWFVQRGLSVAT